MAVTSAVGRISAAHPPPGHLWFWCRELARYSSMAVTSAVGRISAAHPPPDHLWFKIRLRDTHWLPSLFPHDA